MVHFFQRDWTLMSDDVFLYTDETQGDTAQSKGADLCIIMGVGARSGVLLNLWYLFSLSLHVRASSDSILIIDTALRYDKLYRHASALVKLHSYKENIFIWKLSTIIIFMFVINLILNLIWALHFFRCPLTRIGVFDSLCYNSLHVLLFWKLYFYWGTI